MARYKPYEIELLAPFRFWCQKVLPAVYDDSLSYYELLCKVIQKLNEEIDVENEQSEAIVEMASEIIELKEAFDKFQESGFDDYYKAQVLKWIDNHMDYIFENYTRGVYFGLNLEGYFIAVIPQSWSDVVFDTGMNYGEETYGRLILKMDVDSPYTVEQP